MAYESTFRVDPEFDFEADFDEAAEDVPPEYWDRLGEARSRDHLFFIKERIADEQYYQRQLAEMGTGTYIGASILQGVTDPGALALSMSTGGLTAIAKAKRLTTAETTHSKSILLNTHLQILLQQHLKLNILTE